MLPSAGWQRRSVAAAPKQTLLPNSRPSFSKSGSNSNLLNVLEFSLHQHRNIQALKVTYATCMQSAGFRVVRKHARPSPSLTRELLKSLVISEAAWRTSPETIQVHPPNPSSHFLNLPAPVHRPSFTSPILPSFSAVPQRGR
jgi:hypothetical protein